jgi:hypothetical protein
VLWSDDARRSGRGSAADLGSLENGYLYTGLGEVVGARQADDPAADYDG